MKLFEVGGAAMDLDSASGAHPREIQQLSIMRAIQSAVFAMRAAVFVVRSTSRSGAVTSTLAPLVIALSGLRRS